MLRDFKIRIILVLFIGFFFMICASIEASKDPLSSLYGDYDVVFTGQVGGYYQPTNSLVSGTTTGIINFSKQGAISMSKSKPGVIAVDPGETIPGVNPDDVIFGAAVMQNPIHVFMGTLEASQAGDFGIHSMMEFGIPSGPTQIFESACTPTKEKPFICVPKFFQRANPAKGSVNLIYFTTRVYEKNNGIVVEGKLVDKHSAEATVVNIFNVPVESPILGSFNDSFMFDKGLLFQMMVSGNNISGWIKGTSSSIAGLVPQSAVFQANFQGSKR